MRATIHGSVDALGIVLFAGVLTSVLSSQRPHRTAAVADCGRAGAGLRHRNRWRGAGHGGGGTRAVGDRSRLGGVQPGLRGAEHCAQRLRRRSFRRAGHNEKPARQLRPRRDLRSVARHRAPAGRRRLARHHGINGLCDRARGRDPRATTSRRWNDGPSRAVADRSEEISTPAGSRDGAPRRWSALIAGVTFTTVETGLESAAGIGGYVFLTSGRGLLRQSSRASPWRPTG